jgi:hypothetical protein
METAFGIVLFLLVYGLVGYIIYDDVTGHRARVRLLRARRARLQRRRPRHQLVSGSQR